MIRASHTGVLTYNCSPGIVWVRDADQSILVEQTLGRCWRLAGDEEIAWDLLALGYSFNGAARLLSALQETTIEAAAGTLLAMLEEWQAAGIVQAKV